MKERNKGIIQRYQRKKNRDYDFPEEHLGIGDRLILNRVVNEVSEHHRNYTPGGKLWMSTVLLYDINEGMKRFGYKVREISPEC